jgi:ribonuclease P protein component
MQITSFSKKELDHFFEIARPALKVAGLTFLYASRIHKNARILIITSKKVGSAPERNKIRRRLKELFHKNNGQKLLYDLVIITQKVAITYSFDELKLFLEKAIKNIIVKNNHAQ